MAEVSTATRSRRRRLVSAVGIALLVPLASCSGDDGSIEVLPVPTRTHQHIVKLLLFCFDAHARATGGRVGFAGTPQATSPPSLQTSSLSWRRHSSSDRVSVHTAVTPPMFSV